MKNSALLCFIHEELMCKSLSMKKKMFTIGESLLITQANEREEQTQQW